MYQVNLEQFSGPLEKLLELVEARKLEITRVNLADVTADFIAYTKRIEREAPVALIADFLVVAARLLLIKSKALLPDLALTEEEETEILDLETRLTIYREFKSGGARIAAGWSEHPQMFSRPLFRRFAGFFYPSPGLAADDLATHLRKLLVSLEAFIAEPERVRAAIVSVEAKIKEILARFTAAAGHEFRAIAQGQSRTEVVALFLAVLQLLKDRVIHVEQGEQFGDILLKQTRE